MNAVKCGLVIALLVTLTGPVPGAFAQDDTQLKTTSDTFFGLGRDRIRQPTIIDAPGHYTLDRKLFSGQATAIQIEADDVSLDLAGLSIKGPGDRQGVGISVLGASNVRIFNGHLQRLGIGVLLDQATNVTIENLQIDGVDSGGAPPDVEIGILLLDSRGARIVDNVITHTFLGIFVRGEGSGGNRISGNLITGGDNGELAICYNPAPGANGGGPDGDLVTNNVISRFRRGLSLSQDSAGNIVRDNSIAYFDVSIQEGTADSNLIEDNHLAQIVR